MEISDDCLACLVRLQMDRIKDFPDKRKNKEFLKKVFMVLSQEDDMATAPECMSDLNRLFQDAFGADSYYREIKREHNQKMLENEEQYKQIIEQSADPLYRAMELACMGNYIDYAVSSNISQAVLEQMMEEAGIRIFGCGLYQRWTQDLARAEELLYITDNCGEIVLDKLLIQQIKKRRPDLLVTVMVRGEEALNDATMEDAEQAGIEACAAVISNGSDLAGTVLSRLPQSARKAWDRADVVLAKGQGNCEGLSGCGKNVYYLLLCKCALFQKLFCQKPMGGVFTHEDNLPDSVWIKKIKQEEGAYGPKRIYHKESVRPSRKAGV